MAENTWGYWGKPTATIDWCEANYVYTPYIAEFFNTISNIFLILFSALGVRMCIREGHSVDLMLLFGVIALVGVGSAAFHGTLLKSAQQLDETPMIVAITQFCYTLFRNKLPYRDSNMWIALVFLHNLIFAVLHWHYEWVLGFQLYFSAWTAVAGLRLISMYNNEFKDMTVVRNLIKVYVSAWAIGTTFWMIDLHLCDQINSQLPFNFEGHAWWHVCTGFASYLGPAAIAFFEAQRRGLNPSIQYIGGVLPYIRNKVKQ